VQDERERGVPPLSLHSQDGGSTAGRRREHDQLQLVRCLSDSPKADPQKQGLMRRDELMTLRLFNQELRVDPVRKGVESAAAGITGSRHRARPRIQIERR
jgi:hypothetical protein